MFLLMLVLGAVIGSFLNVLILRLPAEQGIGGRSHCFNCQHTLSAWELIPIFSYIFLKGCCSSCGQKISVRYICIELFTALAFIITYTLMSDVLASADFSSWLLLIRSLFIIAVLIVVFMIDFEHYLILDKVVFPSTAILLGLNIWLDFVRHNSFSVPYFLQGLISAAGLSLFFWSLHFFSKGRWMGLGDVKYALFLGLALPFPLIIPGAFLAFFIGSVVGVILIVTGNKTMGSKVPFGTFLSIAALISVWFGQGILNWYLGLIGLR
jgi:prepilin signal peptidase PulO-like enzyme (type II secretory pathway)